MSTVQYNVQDKQIPVQIEAHAEGYQVTIGDRVYNIQVHKLHENGLNLSIDGKYKQLYFASGADMAQQQIWFSGQSWQVEKVDRRSKNRRASAQAESGALTASMPGQVREILVEEGEEVQKGDPLIVLEAMKMETRILAPVAGRATKINCAVGDVVERGQTLIVVIEI